MSHLMVGSAPTPQHGNHLSGPLITTQAGRNPLGVSFQDQKQDKLWGLGVGLESPTVRLGHPFLLWQY